jgi:outer membrane murein-binding lipoprotein Lpp
MKKSILFPIITIFILLSILLPGCQLTGISQDQYDRLSAEFADVQAKLDQAQKDLSQLKDEKDAVDSHLAEAQSTITSLQGQLQAVQEQSSLVSATKAETAEKIVKYYHETHVYDLYDLFVCSDMAAEVWNMLKAQGIHSIITVGNVETAIDDILLCNHAWVLAEVEPGKYLALETTGGYSVPAGQNHLYYRGWVFESPAALKSHNAMIREYNVRVTIRNEMAQADRDIVAEYNQSTSQAQADKLLAVHDELVALVRQQEADLNDLMAEINKLSSALS